MPGDPSSDASRVIVVLTTVGSEEDAEKIARHLIDRRLAACVNIVPGVRSIYRWKNQIEDDRELLLLVKTTEPSFAAACAAIREVHPYELPEVIALPARFAESEYANWLVDCVAARS